jgi:hypothetical protein
MDDCANINCTTAGSDLTLLTPLPPRRVHCVLAVLSPGFYAALTNGSRITAAQTCPQKYYCPGGTPLGPFNPANPAARPPQELTVVPCPDGMWTQQPGATGVSECGECFFGGGGCHPK